LTDVHPIVEKMKSSALAHKRQRAAERRRRAAPYLRKARTQRNNVVRERTPDEHAEHIRLHHRRSPMEHARQRHPECVPEATTEVGDKGGDAAGGVEELGQLATSQPYRCCCVYRGELTMVMIEVVID